MPILPFISSPFCEIEICPEIKSKLLLIFVATYEPTGGFASGNNNLNSYQHKGYGKNLIKNAENIAINYGFKQIAIISGTGVRDYYRKLGYILKDTYMIKNI